MQIGSTARIKRLPPSKRLIKFIGRATFWCLQHAASLLRPWSVRLLGGALGSMFYMFSARYRRVALKNLTAVYGHEKSDVEIKRIARQVFKHFARAGLEFFYVLSLKPDQIDALIDLDHRERLDGALAEGRGCIIITAHYGNWELLARKLVISGYKVNVIARDSDDPGMTGIATRIRESAGYRVFDKDQPIVGAFRGLKNNEILGILPDQNESEGIFVDFFGRPASTAVGPALLSLRSGAPIVPVFAPATTNGKYKATAYPRIEFSSTGDSDRDVHDLTALINEAIEQQIRRDPSKWLWLHDRWKRSSEAPTSADSSAQ